MDAQSGPWSISVAETPYDDHSYSLYVKTPTHNLTLTRTTKEILDLNHRLRESHPGATVPSLPSGFASYRPTPKRKSNFLNTLSRFASPASSKSASKRSNHPSAPPSSFTTPLVSPQHEKSDPFSSFGDNSDGSVSNSRSESTPSGVNPLGQPSSVSTALASYLTAISNSTQLRQARVWKRFIRVRPDDLESVRVERAIKRVRSDLASHVSPKATTADGHSGGKSAVEIDKENMPPPSTADTVSIKQQPTDSTASIKTSDQQSIVESTNDAESGPTSPETTSLAPTESQAPSESAEDSNAEESSTPAVNQTEGTSEVATPTSAVDPGRIHRSQSADFDKSTRVNRIYSSSQTNTRDRPLSQTGSEKSTSTSNPDLRSAKKKRSMSTDGKDSALKKRSQRKVVVDDFEMMRVLGKGCAGKVLLVRHKNSGDLFAMKAITKRHVLAHQELQHTLTEQAVLKKMAAGSTDPFVVKLWWSFHDKENLFLVMDFHPGGDLATQLARWGRLGRDRARFYAAEIVEGVEGLHASGVIYRDLKPENILIGSDGHIVLTDFGLSKEFERVPAASTAPSTPSGTRNGFYTSLQGTPQPTTPPWMKTDKSGEVAFGWPAPSTQTESTSTFCGTAEYLAPEVIQGLPYSYQVDWWSFGTMLFEMLTGITPFWANNHSDMYLRVLQDELQFPDDRAMDPDTKSLIRGLLQRNPALRMCEPRIKRHPYFSMIDWTHVYYKRYIPPYIPPIDPANASDTQNFDDTFLGMEPVLDDPNDFQEDTDQEREQTDTDRTDGEDSNTPSQSRSSSAHPNDEELDDVFDGYSFKGRHSVLIDEEEEGVSSEDEGSEEDEEADVAGIQDMDIANLRDNDAVVDELPSSSVDAGEPKTPEARPQTLPEERPEIEAAVIPAPAPKPESTKAIHESPKPRRSKDLPSVVSGEPKRKSKDIPTARFTEDLPTTPIKETRAPRAHRNQRQKREKSGVPALDKYLSDQGDDEDGTGKDDDDEEDDDWDFVEAVDGEEDNGARGTSLFARGVVDRYKLAVFRKPTPSQRPAPRTFSGMSKASGSTIGDSPESSTPNLMKRGRTPLTFRKNPRQFLQPKSPSNKSSLNSKSISGSNSALSASSSTSQGLLTPSPSMGTSESPTLRSKESALSMGVESISSDHSGGVDTAAELTDNGKPITDKEKSKKKLKKYKQNAEKMFNLFSSPRP
jgi:serum/glucocorticoid-regulated kinase 2